MNIYLKTKILFKELNKLPWPLVDIILEEYNNINIQRENKFFIELLLPMPKV